MSSMSAAAPNDSLAQDFVAFAVESGVLRFGEFKTKAGREPWPPARSTPLCCTVLTLLWPGAPPESPGSLAAGFESANTASAGVKNRVYPLPRDRNRTSLSVWPWLASKLIGRLP